MKPKTSKSPLSILFVDDEPKVIRGLVRAVKMSNASWRVQLATSGKEALQLLDNHPVNIIVSDLRMPEMDGAEFLVRAYQKHPHTLRFVLSGYAQEDLFLKTSGYAHRFLAKPCDTRQLLDAIRQVIATERVMRNKEVAFLVNETRELHVDNGPLQSLLEITNDPECNLDDLRDPIAAMPTVHALLLHLANTGFFGGCGLVESMDEALQMLGLDFVRSLVILEAAKNRCNVSPRLKLYMDSIIKHSVDCSQIATRLRSQIKQAKILQALTSVALLHDLGKLVLLLRKKESYAELCDASIRLSRPLWQLEREHYGCDHAMVGAYLLQLWGLPEPLVRSVAGHHDPRPFSSSDACLVSLLHLVNALAHQNDRAPRYCGGKLDSGWIDKLGLSADLDGPNN